MVAPASDGFVECRAALGAETGGWVCHPIDGGIHFEAQKKRQRDGNIEGVAYDQNDAGGGVDWHPRLAVFQDSKRRMGFDRQRAARLLSHELQHLPAQQRIFRISQIGRGAIQAFVNEMTMVSHRNARGSRKTLTASGFRLQKRRQQNAAPSVSRAGIGRQPVQHVQRLAAMASTVSASDCKVCPLAGRVSRKNGTWPASAVIRRKLPCLPPTVACMRQR